MLSIDTSNGNEDKLIDILLKYLDNEKIDVKVISDGENRPNLVAKYGDRKPIIGLISHSDTVPIGPYSLWKYNPLGEIKDGLIFGRGAADNKGPLVTQLLTFEKLVESGIKGIKFIVFADEERQKKNTGARWLIRNNWDDVKCNYALGEGGGAFLYRSRSMLVVGYGERGAAEVEYKIHLKSSHTSLNDNYKLLKSLIENLAKNIRIRDYRSKKELKFILENLGLKWFLGLFARLNSSLRKLISAYTSISILPTYIELGGNNGYYNMMPSELKIAFNMRLVPGMEKDEVERLVNRISNQFINKGLEFKAKMLTFIPSKKSPLNTDFISFLKRNINNIGYDYLLPIIAPASTDLAWYREKGVPSYGFFPATKNVFKYLLTSHAPNEHISINDLVQATLNMISVIKDYKEKR